MEAAPTLTAIDVRTVFITNKRVIFQDGNQVLLATMRSSS
jgi:hypothetical protein